MDASRSSAPKRLGRGHLLLLIVLCAAAAIGAYRRPSEAVELPPSVAAKNRTPDAIPSNAEFDSELAEGIRLIEEHRYRSAGESLLRAQALRPTDAEVHFQLGLNHLGLLEFDHAEAYLEMAGELEPDNARYVFGMAKLLGQKLVRMEDSFAKLGLATRSKRLIDRAIELDGELVDARLARMLFCMLAPAILGGGIDRAREEILLISQVEPAVGLFAEAWLAEEQEELADAESLYLRSIELDPDYARSHYRLGGLLLEQERFEAAHSRFEDCLRIDPRGPRNHEGLGRSLAGLGRCEEAIQHYRLALEIDPENASPIFGEAECLDDLGELPAAREAFRRFIESAVDSDEERIDQAQSWLAEHSTAK